MYTNFAVVVHWEIIRCTPREITLISPVEAGERERGWTENLILQMRKQTKDVRDVKDACGEVGTSEAAHYRRKPIHSGMEVAVVSIKVKFIGHYR